MVVLTPAIFSQSTPSGFVDEYFKGIWNGEYSEPIVGITFDETSRLFAWTKEGKVYVYQSQSQSWSILLDIRGEVNSSLDGGMLGFALDPDFSFNGYFYVYYSTYVGTAAMGRVKRFKVVNPTVNNPVTDYQSTSNKILIGETASTGIPTTILSHSGGTLVFGTDGSLIVSTGDGAYYSNDDNGSHPNTDYQAALNEGTMTFSENIGANRAQLLSSHCGKLLRIDPNTGNGLPSNPFFNAAAPRSPQSRVWALGLRNPFRVMHIPLTGNHTDDPGDFLIGDVGQSDKEEYNVASKGGQNFGWPYQEGMDIVHDRPLIYWFGNPVKPIIDYRQGAGRAIQNDTIYDIGSTRVPGINPMIGNSAIAGLYYDKDAYPVVYKNTFFVGDASGTIFNVKLDDHYHVEYVNQFVSNIPGGIVSMAIHPTEGSIYYVSYGDLNIRRICYSPSNRPPIARITSDTLAANSPLVSIFSAIDSYDLDNQTLTYQWDFGDNSPTETGLTAHHVLKDTIQTTYKVKLTVMDTYGAKSYDSVYVSVNNTPPVIKNSSIDTLHTIAANQPYRLTLSTFSTDDHTDSTLLSYTWQISLAHNDHVHIYTTYTGNHQNIVLPALGCELGRASYWYRIGLTVTDQRGLSSSYTKDIGIHCGGLKQSITFPAIANKQTTASAFTLSASASSGLPVSYYLVSGPASVVGQNVTLTGRTGKVTLRSTQHGNEVYDQALIQEQSFWVTRPTTQQTVSFDSIPAKSISDSTVSLYARSSSGLPISYLLISGPAILSSGNLLTLTRKEGVVRVRAIQVGNDTINGAYKERLFAVVDPCPPSLSISQNITSSIPVTYRAAQRIEATNLIKTGAAVIFQGGASIELLPGFQVEKGAVFRAQIGGCK